MSTPDKIDFARLAREANVDRMVVWNLRVHGKRGISSAEIARVQAVLNSYPADLVSQAFKKVMAGSVVIAVPHRQRLNEYGGRVLQAFQHAANQARFEVILYDQENDHVPDLASLFSAFDAVLMIVTLGTQALIEACEAAGRPYVMVECDVTEVTRLGRRITVDNVSAAEAILRHLLDLGHRRIAFLTVETNHPSALERLAAYTRMLQQAGIPLDDALVIRGDWYEGAGYSAAQTLLALPAPPTAIFAVNDMIAFGAMRATLEKGLRIPEDLSVAGFDDIAIAASFSPSLTTVRQNGEAIGQLACDFIQQELQGNPPQVRETVFPAELVIRQSTGPAPHR